MKNAKLLKSAVLSTALLFVGGAQAQSDDGTTAITLQTAASVTVVAGNLSFGTHNVPSAQTNVVLTCPSSLSTGVIVPAPTAAGNCGIVTVNTSSASSVGYLATATATAMTGGGGADLAAPTIVVYNGAGVVQSGTDAQSVTQSSQNAFRVGGTVALPANQAAGTYSGTYTFTASIQ